MPSRIQAGAISRHLRVLSGIALLVMATAVVYFTSEGSWRIDRTRDGGGYSGRFFTKQAQAITEGRLDVERLDLQGECWDRDGHCYGYFGLTPSLLRLPFLVLRPRTPLYLSLAILIGYWTALRLLARALVEFRHPDVSHGAVLGYFVVGALALGPGGALLFLTRPAVYEEAAAWSVAFFLMALERVWAWSRTDKTWPLVFAVLFGIAAANSRPTAVSACIVLGILVAVLSRVTAASTAAPRRRGRVWIAAVCLSVLPLATSAGVFWLKFRTPFPNLTLNEQVPEAPFWREVLRINGGKTRGMIFLPTELVAYLRPDGVTWRNKWPYADFAFPDQRFLWLPPLAPGGAYVEPFVSPTTTMPVAWAVTVVVMFRLAVAARRPVEAILSQRERILSAGLLASAAALTLLTVTTVGIANRYVPDFFPIAVVGMAIGSRVILPALGRNPILRVMATVAAVLLTCWSVVVTLLLTVRLVLV